jgi:hypothetical protein
MAGRSSILIVRTAIYVSRQYRVQHQWLRLVLWEVRRCVRPFIDVLIEATESESESELLYDWRFTANQFVLATGPLRPTTSNFIFQLNTCRYGPCVTSSLTRGWVCRLQLLLSSPAQSFSGPAGGSWPHFTVSDLRLPQPGGPGPCIYIPRNRVARL